MRGLRKVSTSISEIKPEIYGSHKDAKALNLQSSQSLLGPTLVKSYKQKMVLNGENY